MVAYINFTHFYSGQVLSANGSIFTKWYLRLRTSLQRHDALYTVIEPLGASPGEDVDRAMVEAFCDRRDCYTLAQNAIFNMMYPEMSGFWKIADSNEIISDLKLIFEPEIRMLRHEHLEEFLSYKMDEHDCVGLHLVRMHVINRHLTVELEYEMSDDFAKSVVLRSLPQAKTVLLGDL
jgi:hypothetical protein